LTAALRAKDSRGSLQFNSLEDIYKAPGDKSSDVFCASECEGSDHNILIGKTTGMNNEINPITRREEQLSDRDVSYEKHDLHGTAGNAACKRLEDESSEEGKIDSCEENSYEYGRNVEYRNVEGESSDHKCNNSFEGDP